MRFLGIDTSCYTTSAAVYDSSKGLMGEERIVLSVKEGRRGLSQSEMVFQHVKNLPVLLRRLSPLLQDLKGIGVSGFPRRRADSYMPAFLVGRGMAEALSSSHHIPLYVFSHQENHAMAAIREATALWGKPFYITAGQFIDRVGVALGLPFPCGKWLEVLAEQGNDTYRIPRSSVKGAFSFSGPETRVQRDIASDAYRKEDIAKGVLIHIGRALEKELSGYPFEKGRPFIAVGGVMANRYLQARVEEICQAIGLTPLFADPRYSSDNATGNAFGAYMKSEECGIRSDW